MNKMLRANRLRSFPSASQGRDRLFPFARPKTTLSRPLPENPAFFIAGNCFARGLESALRGNGFKVLSSAYSSQLSEDAVEQFQRFNKFNTDVVVNEVEWATGLADNMDAALIEVAGELVDMQLHFTVAGPPDEMRERRRLFNDAFKPAQDADVIILIAGGRRQFFDREAGVYLNSIPSHKMTALYPDRFELHSFDLDEMETRLQRAIDVFRTVRPDVHLILVNSPVYQPVSFSPDDALLDQTLSKSMQRLAIANVIARNDGVDYLPAYEMTTLSDYQHSFVPNSPNHTMPDVAIRAAADMLAAGGIVDARQRKIAAHGFGKAYARAKMPDEAIKVIEAALLDDDGNTVPGTERDLVLHHLYLSALMASGRSSDAVAEGMQALRTFDIAGIDEVDEDEDDISEISGRELGAILEERSGSRLATFVRLLSRSVFTLGSDEDKEYLRDFVVRHELDLPNLETAGPVGQNPKITELLALSATGEHERVLELVAVLDIDRAQFSQQERDTIDLAALQSGIKTEAASVAIDRAIGLHRSEGVQPRLLHQLCNHVRGRGSISQIDAVIELSRNDLDLAPRVQKLTERRAFLARKAGL